MPITKDLPQHPEPAAIPKPTSGEAVDRGEGNGGVGGNDLNGSNRGPLVGVILAMLVLATVAMVGFIWYRWSEVREPTTAVIVDGDASLAGTEITVTGDRTVKATIDASNNYHVPILVEPGEYLVTAQFRGKTLVRTTVQVKRFLGVEFDLPTMVKDAVARGVLTLDAPTPPPAVATQPR